MTGTGLKADRYTSVSSQRAQDIERRERRELRTLLNLLMLDAAYRAAYERLENTIGEARGKLTELRRRLTAALALHLQQHEALVANAAVSIDGQPAFWTEDGRWLNEGGESTEVDLAVDEARSSGLPSWNEYARSQTRYDDLNGLLGRTDIFEREILDSADGRRTDSDNPLSLEELERTDRDIKQSFEALENSVKAAFSTEAPITASDLSFAVGTPNFDKIKVP